MIEICASLLNALEKGVQSADPLFAVRQLAPPTAAAAQLRGMVHHRDELVTECTQRKNKLTAICDELFPELVQVYKNPNLGSALALRKAFPTPTAVATASCSALCATRLGHKPSTAQLAELQELAAHTIGTRDPARIRGYDAHKHVKGRKRHILVDTLGLPLSVYVSPAAMHDTQGTRRLLAGLKYFVPRLKRIWADAAYRGQELADWCKAQGDWDLEVVERTPGVHGFAVLPKRWIVEPTFGWLSRNRRLSKDYEGKVQTSETLIEVAMIRLLIARQGRPT